MGRLLAVVCGLWGLLLVPIALAPQTAWLVVPAHLGFTLLAAVAAVGEGIAGRGGSARAFGGWHLVATVLAVAALQVGSQVAGIRYWMAPWAIVLYWAWIPAVVSGLSGIVGEWVGERRSARAVRIRKAGGRVRRQPEGPA